MCARMPTYARIRSHAHTNISIQTHARTRSHAQTYIHIIITTRDPEIPGSQDPGILVIFSITKSRDYKGIIPGFF